MNTYQMPAHITAVLGATNTGKTHYAVERMLARASGVIGLPLRLLAREVYDRIVAEKGAPACALITGEEKIVPPHAMYYVCTTEAMPMTEIEAGKFACVAIDEVQMVGHKERGHIFTDRLLYARGTEETLLLGADTVRPIIEALVPKAKFVTRERFSVLSYAGHTKLTRLPKRSVIVAFSADEVYAIAELIRRNYGGAALVMGGLSPRTRNAQAELYQSGEVNYMVATDAIGMGLNLDADHVAFASLRKFDGQRKRYLRASEIAQIAGRAGRFRRDGTFGTTGNCLPLDDDLIPRIENHHFAPLQYAEWRNAELEFSSLENLRQSLAVPPGKKTLRRVAPVPDEMALERLIHFEEVTNTFRSTDTIRRFWDVCQIPDFRNLGPEAHARLLEEIYLTLDENDGRLPDAFLETNIKRLDHKEGTKEIISSRLSSIRTWTYIAHKHVWVENSKDWISRARQVENGLSDALHEKLVQRFVDRRTSSLLKGIGAKTQMDATVTETGDVIAEGHTIGQLKGLLFVPDASSTDVEAKALQQTAVLSLAPEIDRRLTQISGCDQNALTLSDRGEVLWGDAPVGQLVPGDELLKPKLDLIGGKLGSPVLCDLAVGRLRDFIGNEINQKFESLFALKSMAEDPGSFQGARALASVLFENYGVILRRHNLKLVKDTDRVARGYLRNKSVKFGYYHVFLRDLMKPAAARLMSLLFSFAWDKDGGGDKQPFLPPNGMSSTPDDAKYSEQSLNKAGYTRYGPRIIRFDILTRLAEIILQATSNRDDKRFRIAQEMMSLLGCSYEEMRQVLEALNYVSHEVELTPEELEVQTKRILEVHNRQTGKDVEKTEPEKTAVDNSSSSKEKEDTKEPYVPKRQRVAPINDYIVKPDLDENEEPIIKTSVELWARKPKKKYSRPQSSDTSKKHSNNRSKNIKGGRDNRKKQWTSSPRSKNKGHAPQDSPFAALADLKIPAREKRRKNKKEKDG